MKVEDRDFVVEKLCELLAATTDLSPVQISTPVLPSFECIEPLMKIFRLESSIFEF